MSETKKKTAAPKPVSKKPYLTGKPLDSSCIGGALRFFQQFAPAHGSHEGSKLFFQPMGCKDIFFFCQQVAELSEILRRQTLPVHLSGCVRQLVSFVDHQSPVIIEKGPHFLQTVGGVG